MAVISIMINRYLFAAAVDADFLGKVWKREEDSFFIVEKEVKTLMEETMRAKRLDFRTYCFAG